MRWKWLAATGVLIGVVLLVTVYAYLNTYDYNKLKPRIARMATEQINFLLVPEPRYPNLMN